MLHTWKIKIKGNSMEGLFPDGKELRVKVISDFLADDLEEGQIIILKKKPPSGHLGRQSSELISDKKQKEDKKISKESTYSFIIHRIVGKFKRQNQVYFWEKGDNDCYPKICPQEDILGVVIDVEDYPDFPATQKPFEWQQRNKKLLKFYTGAEKIYSLIMGENSGIDQHREEPKNSEVNKNNEQIRGLIKKILRKGFLSLFYLICSFLNLKGK